MVVVEAAARETRYEALAGALEAGEILLTAHHEDDQLETVLLQLMRGAGVAGLAAMPEVTRSRKERWCGRCSRGRALSWRPGRRPNDLTWVDDDSNVDERFDRNYLRRRVLPLIRQRWPGAARTVSRSARHAAEAKGLLDALALADVERASNGDALSCSSSAALAPERRRNAVRFWIARAGHRSPTPRASTKLRARSWMRAPTPTRASNGAVAHPAPRRPLAFGLHGRVAQAAARDGRRRIEAERLPDPRVNGAQRGTGGHARKSR